MTSHAVEVFNIVENEVRSNEVAQMLKRKLIANLMMTSILLVFAIQVTAFGVSISSRKSITGAVYAASGVPVSGASIVATETTGTEGFGYTITNGNGQYTITQGLSSGTYKILAEKPGYLFTEIDSIVVNAPSTTSGVNLYMNVSASISGKVTDNLTGYGIPNISLLASLSSGGGSFYGSALTDISGNYEINMNIGTGTYNVSVLYPKGYLSDTVSPVSATAGTRTTGVNLSLKQSGIISGIITAPDGQPLENITVTAYSGTAGFGSDETDSTGQYRISSGLGTGNYTVMILSGLNNNETTVLVTAGQETPNVDLQLSITPPAPSGTITGKITDADDGKPVVDAHVQATGGTQFKYGDAYTDTNGKYAISSGLEADDNYTIDVSASGYQNANITNISVIINQTTSNVNLQMHKIPSTQSGKISGTVTGDSNAIPEFEYPIAIMMIITLIAVTLAKTSKRENKCA